MGSAKVNFIIIIRRPAAGPRRSFTGNYSDGKKQETMKKNLQTVFFAVLTGAAVGILLGIWTADGRNWEIAMENPEYWEARQAAQESVVQDALEGKIKTARVETPEIEFDFGVKEKNQATVTGSHDFPVKNVGTAPLTLKEKSKSCFCTEFSIAKKTLLPGESTTVNVKWDAERGGGSFKQSVLISTNDPVRPEIFFNVKGLFSAPVVCNPNQLLFSGISNTEANSREFHILGFGSESDGTPKPLQISDADVTVSDPDHFEVTLQPGSLDEMTEEAKNNEVLGKATALIKGVMTIRPGLAHGAFQEIVRFKTARPELPFLEMMVEGQIAGSISISGAKYDKHKTGQLMIGPVSSAKGSVDSFRLTLFDPTVIADAKTVRVESVRPDWLKVRFHYPDAEVQKTMPVKWVDAEVEIPSGSPQERYSGPGLSATGEIVIGIGEGESCQEVILPVSFAVGP